MYELNSTKTEACARLIVYECQPNGDFSGGRRWRGSKAVLTT